MNMKMKMLTAAVTAALGAGSAHAVNVSPDGHGQVLIMPYYTVQANNETLISITNVTDQVKAVKVRFREAQNSAEVLDFNLYLSPFDVWTAKITDSDADDGGAKLITNDNSCTVPTIPDAGVAFRNFVYAGAGDFTGDAGDQGMGRTSEGYVEVIEMGVVKEGSNPAKWATHTASGEPLSCASLNGWWTEFPAGEWTKDNSKDMESPTGAVFGEINVINVEAGVEASEPVTVLDNFYTAPGDLHAAPGSGAPTLADAAPKESHVFVSGAVAVQDDEWDMAVDAVSAVLMSKKILNGYSVNPVVESQTEWVINFPTKHFYINPASAPVLEPFTNNFTNHASLGAGGGGAFEAVTAMYWDREERVPGTPDDPTLPTDGPDFSPTLPPECIPGVDPDCTPVQQPWALPYEVNVVGFENADYGSDFMSSQWASVNFALTDLEGKPSFRTGWAAIDLGPAFNSAGDQVTSDRQLVSKSGTVYTGLPVVGFMATILQNSNVGDGAAYASTAEHRYVRSIEPAVVEPR